MGAMMLANLHGLTRSRPDLLRHARITNSTRTKKHFYSSYFFMTFIAKDVAYSSELEVK
jgi:hypothetical protein